MSENGAVGESIYARFAALANELPDAITQLEAQRTAIDEELKRLRRVQQAVVGPQPKAPPQTPTRTRQRISDEKMARVAAAILNLPETWGATELMASNVGSQPTIYTTLKVLRERELIGKAGEARNDSGQKYQTYRVLDRAGLEALGRAA